MLLSVPGKVLNRILLVRMRTSVDILLRDQQAGFRKDRSCIDQICTLLVIIEQSLEWNSSLYVNFVDYEKAFHSVDRETLWKLLHFYGVPKTFVTLIKFSYEGYTCRVAHEGQLSDSFEVRTGVRQGCLLSPLLFLPAIYWIMTSVTKAGNNGIPWTPWEQLEDLDYVDDLALLSHNHLQMQDKTSRLTEESAKLGLRINKVKTKVLRINTTSEVPVVVEGQPLENVKEFSHLGSFVDTLGGTDKDALTRIGKARAVFIMLKKVWASKELSVNQTSHI